MSTITMDLTTPIATMTAAPGDTLALRISENSSTAYAWNRVAPVPAGIVELAWGVMRTPPPARSGRICASAHSGASTAMSSARRLRSLMVTSGERSR